MNKGMKEPGMDVKHILAVCEHGNNRSVTFAHILKYVSNFETLTAGLGYHTPETLEMLFTWAEVIVVPQKKLVDLIPVQYQPKIKLYDIGKDVYHRPFNKVLYAKAKALMEKDPL